MSVREKVLRACDTVDEIRKAAVKVVFPIPEKSGHDEFIQMHWCDKCQWYHKAR